MKPPARPWEPTVTRTSQRLTTLYATDLRHILHDAKQQEPLSNYLKLGRLSTFYEHSADQLPHVVLRTEIPTADVTFRRWNESSNHLTSATLWALALPSGLVVVAVTLDVTVPLLETISILEDLYYTEIEVAGTPLPDWALDAVEPGNRDRRATFLPERHQLVYTAIPDESHAPTRDTLQRLIYRADLPSRPGSDAIRFPVELNRRPTSIAAVGAYVSVVAGHQGSLENSTFLSAAQIVASSAELRRIRERAYACVRDYRNDQGIATVSQTQRRIQLEQLSDQLSEMELELSFTVEATADLGMLVPSLRVESFHRDLYRAVSLTGRTETTGRMLARLSNAINAELATVTSIEDRDDDARRTRTVAAVTFVSTVGGTLALLFGFFGINASQVDESNSMFSLVYWPIYALIGSLIVSSLGLYIALRWRQQRTRRNLRGGDRYHTVSTPLSR